MYSATEQFYFTAARGNRGASPKRASCLGATDRAPGFARFPQRRAPRRTLRIVLADDSALVRRSLAEMLARRTRHEVVAEARDGLEAIACVRAHHPDVLVLDMRMPRADGLHVLCELHNDEFHPYVIVFSSDPSSLLRAKCMTAGADYYIEKSGSPGVILSTLDSIAARPRPKPIIRKAKPGSPAREENR